MLLSLYENHNNVDNALVQYNLFLVYNLDKEGINFFPAEDALPAISRQ